MATENNKTSSEPNSRQARRKRMELRRVKYVSGMAVLPKSNKRRKLQVYENSVLEEQRTSSRCEESESDVTETSNSSSSNESVYFNTSHININVIESDRCPKYGVTSVCGRRRDMEDRVSIHPSFFRQECEIPSRYHFFGVFDGHGCSHVAMSCKDRLHEILKEELQVCLDWNETMKRSFSKMDKEVVVTGQSSGASCRCELQTPQCDAVGSTAVVSIVTPDKIVTANCGDSRAVLCRGGKAVPLSSDHKPDRPDELLRIQAAGGRVIYWDGARVLGVLAMSRAIGDNYLKPYVCAEPEVTITERTDADDCLILASDGLWDVISNETACGIARMCLNGLGPSSTPTQNGNQATSPVEGSNKTCSDAALLLTKLAMARNTTDNVTVLVVDLRRST